MMKTKEVMMAQDSCPFTSVTISANTGSTCNTDLPVLHFFKLPEKFFKKTNVHPLRGANNKNTSTYFGTMPHALV